MRGEMIPPFPLGKMETCSLRIEANARTERPVPAAARQIPQPRGNGSCEGAIAGKGGNHAFGLPWTVEKRYFVTYRGPNGVQVGAIVGACRKAREDEVVC